MCGDESLLGAPTLSADVVTASNVWWVIAVLFGLIAVNYVVTHLARVIIRRRGVYPDTINAECFHEGRADIDQGYSTTRNTTDNNDAASS